MIRYLNQYVFKKIIKGLGPLVYLLISKGNTISNGVSGIASKPKLSRDTPFSISFK